MQDQGSKSVLSEDKSNEIDNKVVADFPKRKRSMNSKPKRSYKELLAENEKLSNEIQYYKSEWMPK